MRTGRARVGGLWYDASALTVEWADRRRSRYPAIWLFDNRPSARDGTSGQRLSDLLHLPNEVAIGHASLTAAGDVALDFVAGEGESVFPAAWLRAHALDPASRAERRPRRRLWDAALAADLPRASYAEVAPGGRALAEWLARVRDIGFALLSDVPAEPGTVLRVVELFGYVRETNYGRLFDVRSVERPSNLAYTDLALANHTDNPYRDPVPQLQLLHCLQAAEDGGESVVVDGFAAAERLRAEAPDDFALLTRQPVPFRYHQEGAVDLQAAAPLIELDAEGELRTVRYNGRSMAPLDLPEELVLPFYRAAKRFAEALHDPAAMVPFKLRPGDLFIVDNQRVLHGRRGFGGRRHLQGAYSDKDSLLSRLRVLEAEHSA